MPGSTQKQKLTWGISLGLVALVAMGGGAWWAFHTFSPTALTPEPIFPIPTSGQAKLYWLNPEGTRLVTAPLILDPTQETSQPDLILTAGLTQLLAGPKDASLTTTIPAGTTLRRLDLRPDGIHLDLSAEFSQGGGSTSMQGRLGQVLFTVTSLNPNTPVWIAINGQPLTVLGGEGLEVKQPMTRTDFIQSFSIQP